ITESFHPRPAVTYQHTCGRPIPPHAVPPAAPLRPFFTTSRSLLCPTFSAPSIAPSFPSVLIQLQFRVPPCQYWFCCYPQHPCSSVLSLSPDALHLRSLHLPLQEERHSRAAAAVGTPTALGPAWLSSIPCKDTAKPSPLSSACLQPFPDTYLASAYGEKRSHQ
ncbi:hypothetical protein GH733_001852, partial [Mirounga leonina]